MKKNLLRSILFLFVSLLSIPKRTLQNVTDVNDEEEYVVNERSDWSNEDYVRYYCENNILPTSPNPAATVELDAAKIPGHLSSRFSDYSGWSLTSSKSKDVSAVYGSNPKEGDEDDGFMQAAKASSKIKDFDYIGCGNIALFCELEYLANNVGYTQFLSCEDSDIEKTELCTDIFNTTTSYDKTTDIAVALAQMNITFDEGTFIFPHDLIGAARQLFEDYNINNGAGPEDIEENGDIVKLLKVEGDTLPNFASVSSKTKALKDSIDKGFPVIWWTTNLAGYFSTHFMNIYGYETWKGTNSYGSEKEHTFFKVNMNWGKTGTVYMDCDTLQGLSGGFIFFSENIKKVFIKPSDYGFPQAYSTTETTKDLYIKDEHIVTKRKRTGYINETGFAGTGDWFLTMSCKKRDVDEAYLSYKFAKNINFIYFDVRVWATGDASNCSFKMEYKNKNGEWVTGLDFFDDIPAYSFSSNKMKPEKYRYDFPYGVSEFRFKANSNETVTYTRNKGRVVIGGLGVVFATYGPDDPRLIVSVFSENSNSSSFANFSGHSFVQVFNHSAQDVMLNDYVLPAYEATTFGLWGNKKHTGVYFNYEYYLALTTVEDRASSSSSSSASSSSSIGSSVQSSGNQWSVGSIGVMKWLSKKVRQSYVVSYATGRVSLTKSVPLSSAETIGSYIKSHNNEWWPWYNCSHLATEVWNKLATEEEHINKDWIQTPKIVLDRIKSKEHYETDRCLIGDRNRVGYFTKEGFVQSYE